MTQPTHWQYSEPLNRNNPTEQITPEYRSGYLARADEAALTQGWLILHGTRRMQYDAATGELVATYQAVKA
jgi:hypothetical protein